jgi:tetratricopeptide (TPR) repeat protein
VLREIARGGMGRVLAAFDLTLGRDVALKVLLPSAKPDRFVRESKITARLPHPGIPPVYALGTLADGSQFLAMKLIAGQTLAAEMKSADLPHLLQAFTQVCQAVGFAHSRGVIHRDLKPANVMVGAFGEVQVMDWGLAKQLDSRATAGLQSPEEQTPPTPDADSDLTVDFHESREDLTSAGKIMGTPEYMAPEQARGEPADARTDVFALGGILCKILTGHSPFGGKTSMESIQRAGAADLAEANARLDNCGADAELVAVCRRCLSPNPADRPANGQAVTDGMTAYLNGVQERLQSVERERAVTAAKAIEERRRRKLQVIAASLVLGVLVAGITGTTIGLLNAREQRNLVEARNGQLVVANANAKTEWDRAEKNFATARGLILNIADRINQFESGSKNPQLADMARKQALDEARKQFDQFRESLPDDKWVQMQAAALHRFSANISRSQGNSPAAFEAYAASIQISEELTKRYPDESEHQLTLALTLGDRALFEKQNGRLRDSAATLDQALKLVKNLHGSVTESKVNRTMGWIAHDRSKVAYLSGRFEDALRLAGRASERLEKLSEVPDSEKTSIDKLLAVMAVNDAAMAHRELGQISQAMTAHDAAVGRMKVVAGTAPNRDQLLWSCEVRRERARTQLQTSDRPAATIDDLADILPIAEKLVEENPHLPLYRERLADTYLLRGERLTRQGQWEPASTELTKSLAVSRELIDRFGAKSDYLLVRGRTFLALGRARNGARNPDEAAAHWKNAAKVFELALKSDTDNFHHRRGLSEAQAALNPTAK